MEINCEYCPKNDGIYCCGKIIPYETFYNPHNLDGEIWKDIVGYENKYQISSYGRVKSLINSGVILKYRVNKIKGKDYGYYSVALYNNMGVKCFKIHRLIAQAFIPNIENKPCIDHIDTNTYNNCISNLRWVTFKENGNNPITKAKLSVLHRGENSYFYGGKLSVEHKEKLSIAKKGKLNGNASVKVVQISPKDGTEINEYDSAADAARCSGAKETNIIRCCKKKRTVAAGYSWAYKSEYDKCTDKSIYIQREKWKSLLKPVCQYTKNEVLVREYSSVREAAFITGISRNSISRSATKQKYAAGGYMWKYKTK